MSGGLFQELRVLFTFLSEKEKNEIQSLCREHGGIVMSAITPNDPPHVVVTRRVGSPKYCSVLKRHPMTPVVSPEWIRTSVSEGRKVPYSQYAVGPCYGLKICLSGFFSEDKAKLADLVQESGGTHSASLTKHCTHLVSTSTSSEKYVFAQKHGIACASAQWLTESIRGGWCRDSALYPVQDVSEKSPEEEARQHDRKRTREEAKVPAPMEQQQISHEEGVSAGKENSMTAWDDLNHSDDNTDFLGHCGVWAVGCPLEESMNVLRLCRLSGAKRFTSPHPSLITHIIRGSRMNQIESKEVVQYLEEHEDVPVVTIDWLERSVSRQEEMPVDERFLVNVSDIAKVTTLFDKKVDGSTSLQSIGETNSQSMLSGGGVKKSRDGVFAGYYFTLCAIRGTNEETTAENIIRQQGGRMFNASLPSAVATEKSKAFAICPASLTAIEVNRLKFQNGDFASVPETNRFTVYWLRCCVEAGRVLAPQKGTPCFKPIPFPLPMVGMDKISVAISGYNRVVRSAIKHTVETLGGTVSIDCMSAKDSHLLIPAAHGEKYRHSERLGVCAVTADWLVDSVASGRLLPEAMYKPAPLPGKEREKFVDGPSSGRVDVSQHPWVKLPHSQASKDFAQALGQRVAPNNDDTTNTRPSSDRLGRQHSVLKGKQHKFTMPSLAGTIHSSRGAVNEAPSKEQDVETGPRLESGGISMNQASVGRVEDKAPVDNQPTPKSLGDLSQAMHHVSSILHRIQAENNTTSTSVSRETDDGTKRPTKKKSRPIRSLAKASHTPSNDDLFDISQRVEYDIS